VRSGPAASEFDLLLSDGCISRSVRDTALFLSVVEAESALPRLGYVREPSPRRLHIGYTALTLFGTEPDAECRRALESTVALCRELGHQVEPAAPAQIDAAALSQVFFAIAGRALVGMSEMIEPLLDRHLGSGDLEPFTRELMAAAREPASRELDVQGMITSLRSWSCYYGTTVASAPSSLKRTAGRHGSSSFTSCSVRASTPRGSTPA
jgi:Asp-tRNA(Asn)/Glu-tRNA(Gln) amidotransferase A subunit family amidase